MSQTKNIWCRWNQRWKKKSRNLEKQRERNAKATSLVPSCEPWCDQRIEKELLLTMNAVASKPVSSADVSYMLHMNLFSFSFETMNQFWRIQSSSDVVRDSSSQAALAHCCSPCWKLGMGIDATGFRSCGTLSGYHRWRKAKGTTSTWYQNATCILYIYSKKNHAAW